MTEITERLRGYVADNAAESGADVLLLEAADRIEALEMALKASRLVLIERGISPESRIVRVIDTALRVNQQKSE